MGYGQHAAHSNPIDPSIKAGQVTIAESERRLDVRQSSDKAIIDWRGFSIGVDETTRFHQPSASSLTLNRVTGGDPSAILGRLQANGQIMLVNPNGVLFGPGSRIDVGGLVATTSDIHNDDFLTGNYDFSIPSPNPNAMVANEGAITVAEAGYAALVAPAVRNSGTINARLGRVTLGAAQAFTLDLYGDNLVAFQVGVDETPLDANGEPVGALVKNSGTIIADAGSVTLAADQVGAVVRNVINMDGMIQANAFENQGGRVVLGVTGQGTARLAGNIDAKGGTVEIAGSDVVIEGGADVAAARGAILVTADGDATLRDTSLSARQITIAADTDLSGAHDPGTNGGDAILENVTIEADDLAAATGGRAEITGDRVALLGNTMIDASGSKGGGEVLIGGDYQGGGGTRTADTTVMADTAVIHVDAEVAGDGGTAILWADEVTRFYGDITALGGSEGGDGGLVETSGKGYLAFGGSVDLTAVLGELGTLLLDPVDIVISNADNTDGANGGTILTTDLPAAEPWNVSPAALDAVAGNISLAATNDITVTDALTLNTAGATLTLDANNDINVDADITTNAAAITLSADDDASSLGGINVAAGVAVNSGGAAISMEAFDMAIDGTASINSGASRTTLLAAVGTTSLGDTTLNLNLSDAELDTITANVLQIGDATTGALQVLGAISPANTATMRLQSAGSITDSAAGGITIANLRVQAGTSAILDAAGHDVDAISIDGGGGSTVNYTDGDDLVLGGVDGGGGIGTQRTTLIVNGDLTINDNITGSRGVTIRNNGVDATTTLNAAVRLTASSNRTILIVTDDLEIGAAGSFGTNQNSGTHTLNIETNTAGQQINFGGANTAANGTMELTNDELGRLNLGTQNLDNINIGAIGSTGQVTFSGSTSNFSGGIGRRVIKNNADMIQTAAATMGTVTLNAATGITLNNVANDFTGTLTASTNAGNITIVDANNLTTNVVSASAGTVSLTARGAESTLTLNNVVTAANGAHTYTADKIAINNAITATGQTVNIASFTAGNAVNLGSAVDTTPNTLEISDAELDRIAAGNLIIGDANAGSFTVNGISNTSVTGTVTLNALQDNATLTFDTAPSSFSALSANADDRITVNQDVATTVGNLALDGDADGAIDINDDIVFADGVTVSTASGLTLLAQNGGLNPLGALTLSAANGLTFGGDLALGGNTTFNADNNADGAGVFTVNGGATVSTAGNPLAVIAADIDITAGFLNSGGAATTITRANAGTIGLGATAGDLQITGPELQRITAGGLTLGDANTTLITVNGITAVNSDTVNTVTLNALSDTGTIAFSTAASTFDGLAANANDTIAVNFNVTTDEANLALEGDADNADDAGSDNIDFADAITVDAFGSLILDGTTGGLVGGNALTLNARDGVNINDNLSTTAGALVIDADTDTAQTNADPDDINIAVGVSITAGGELSLLAANGSVIGAGATTFNILDGFVLGADLTTAGATVINADSNGDGTGDFTLNGGSTIDTTDNTLTITADDMALNGSIDSGTAATTLLVSNGGTIDLGAAGGDLNLGNAELQTIAASALTIGDGTAGAFVVGADIAPGATAGADVTTLNLVSGAGVTATAGGIVEDKLSITAGGTVNMTAAATDVGTLAIGNTGQAATFNDPNGVIIGAVGGVTGISAAALTVNADDGITVDENITTTGTTVLDADADGDGTGDLTVATGKTVTTTGNSLSVTANDITLTGDLDSGAAATTLLVSDGGTVGLGATAGDYTITGTELGRITATGLTIGDATNGNITVDGIAAVDSDQIAGTVTLNATANEADVAFSGAASTFNALTVNADDSIVVNQDITTALGDLALVADFDDFDDTGPDQIQFGAGTITLSTAGALTLQATTGGITAAGTLGLNVDDGFTLGGDLTLAGALTIDADADDDGTGTFTVNAGADLSTTNNPLSIVADDIDIQGTGTISSGTAATSISRSTAGTIGLGAAAGDLHITGAELQQITANGLSLGGANTTAITVDGISATNSEGVDAVTLNATANAGTIAFTTGASTFDALTANANDGLSVSIDITTDTGDLALDGDADDADDAGADNIAFTGGRTLTSAGAVTLDATTGNMTADNALTLNAAGGISFNDSLTTAGGTVTVDADTNADGTGALSVAAAKSITTNNNTLAITADDLTLTGTIDSGNQATTITVSDNGTLALGTTGSNFNIDDAELNRISATGLTLNSGSITVDTVAATDSDQIDGTVTLNATQDNDTIIFTGASTFDALMANADDGIDVNGDLTTAMGSLALDGDADNAADTADNIDFAATLTLTSNTNITLDATTGDMAAAGRLDLDADDAITINDSITAAGELDLRADFDDTGAGDFVLATGASLDSSGGGNIVIGSDTIDLSGNLTAGANKITLRPSNVGAGRQAITLAGAGAYDLSALELDRITTTGVLQIGSAATTSTVTVGADIAPANAATLSLVANGNVTATAGGIIETNLAVLSTTGPVNITAATTDVNTVAISTTGQIDFTDANSFTVDTVAAVTGITNNNGSIGLTANTGSITLNEEADSSSASGGLTTITADGGTITVNDSGEVQDVRGKGVILRAQLVDIGAGVNVRSRGGGSITVTTDDLVVDGSFNVDGAYTFEPLTTGRTLLLGAVDDFGNAALEISEAELDSFLGAATMLAFGSDAAANRFGTVTVQNAIDPDSAPIVDMRITATGAVTQAALATITSPNLAIDTQAAITLNEANVADVFAATTTTGDIQYTDTDALTIGTDMGFTSGFERGVVNTGGGATISTNSGDLTLADAGIANDIDATGDITLLTATADNSVTIGANTDIESLGGTVTVQADDIVINTASGSITNTGRTVVLRSATDNEAIDLGNGSAAADSDADNILKLSSAELARITAGQLTVGHANAGAISVTADVTSPAATLDLSTASTVDADAVSGGGIIATNLAVTAGGDVDISEASTAIGTIAVSAAGWTVAVDEVGGIDLGAVAGVTGVTAGTFTLTTSGAITDSAASTVTGTTTLDSGATTNDVTLDNAANDFATVSVTQARNVTLVDSDGIDLGASTVSGALSVTASGTITDSGAFAVSGTATLDAGAVTNDITLDSANDFATLAITQARNVTLTDVNAIDLGASTVAGVLSVTANGTITDSGALVISGTTTLDAGAVTNDITLDEANDFATVAVTQARNVTLVDSDAIDFDTSTISGALNVTANGTITDSGALAVAGTATLDAGAATNDVTLDNAANDFATLAVTQARNVILTDVNAIDLGASTISGTLDVTANGTITDSAALAVTGTATLDAGAATNDIALDSANDFATVVITQGRNVSLTDVNAIDLGASTVSGTLDITANGAITDSGALAITGLATLAAGAANNITLDEANDFATVAVTSGNNVALVDSNAIDLGASAVAGTLNVTANGTITDSAALAVTGTATLDAGAATNDVTLDEANDFATVAVTQARNVTLVDSDAIDLGASVVSGTLAVTANGTITDSGALAVTGTATLDAGAVTNDITLDEANDFATVAVTQARNVTLTDVNAVDLGASTASGALNVTANGTIVDSGALAVAGTATLDSGAVTNDVTLDNAANDFATVAVTQARNVTLVDSSAIDLGASVVSGTLAVTANGAITDSGALAVTGLASLAAGGANDIALDSATNDFSTVALATGNNVTLVDANALTLNAATIEGALGLTAVDGVTLAGNLTSNNTNAGASTIDADSDNDGIGDFTVAGGTTLATGGNALTVTANDLILDGSLNSGAVSTALLRSTLGTIGLGGTPGGYSIDDAELGRITAAGLVIGGALTNAFTVNGITAANSNNITGAVTLNATANTGDVTFDTAASTFNALNVNADDGIAVNVALSTDIGSLALEGDADNAVDGNDDITLTADLASAGGITLDATMGGLVLGANQVITAGGAVSANNAITGANVDLVVNAGTANVTFTSLDLGAAAGTLSVTGGNVDTGNLLIADTASLNGAIVGSGVAVRQLTLTGANANMSGTINGVAGDAAALLVGMPDAPSHLFNGCQASGCAVVAPPGGSGAGSTDQLLSPELIQDLSTVNRITVEDGAEENEGVAQEFDIQGQNRSDDQARLADESHQEKLGRILMAMENEARQGLRDQANGGTDDEADCDARGTDRAQISGGSCGGAGREAAPTL